VYPDKKLKIFTGTANIPLAEEIAQHIGIPLGKGEIQQFCDGEITSYIGESVRGADVFVVQPLAPPTNDNIMELLIMIDAIKRASAKSINAVIPYFGYARQDRKTRARDPITAKLLADLITTSGPLPAPIGSLPWICMRVRSRGFSTFLWTIFRECPLLQSTSARSSWRLLLWYRRIWVV